MFRIDTGKLFRETKKQANYIAEYYDYYAGLADKVEGRAYGKLYEVGLSLERTWKSYGSR